MQKYVQLDLDAIAQSCSRKHISDIMQMMLADLQIADILATEFLANNQLGAVSLAQKFKQSTN